MAPIPRHLFSSVALFVLAWIGVYAAPAQNELSSRASSPQDPYGFFPLSKTLPLCLPPQGLSALGWYPKSAVTLTQTGTNCNKYGDPPAKIVGPLLGPTDLQNLINICHGEIIHFTDNFGTPRMACFYANPNSTKEKPLPLLVWLHPSAVTAYLTWPLTGLDLVRDTQPLNNEDPSALGFSYILPVGRATVHQYPVPDNTQIGWDNWYRNYDRNDPRMNPDANFVDQAIAHAKQNAVVDPRRVFISGWSNGAAFGMQYALNTDKIAAASVYSAPDPYRDSQDPCAQTPYPRYATPIQDVHNECDLIGICTTGKYFYDDLHKRYGSRLQNSLVVIDVATAKVLSRDTEAHCDPACQGVCAVTTGATAHLRYPVTRNDDTVLKFLVDHPLPNSGTWGRP